MSNYALNFNVQQDQLVFVGPFDTQETVYELQFHNPGNTTMHYKVKCNDNTKFKLVPASGSIASGQYESILIYRSKFKHDPATGEGDKVAVIHCPAVGDSVQASFTAAPASAQITQCFHPVYVTDINQVVPDGAPPIEMSNSKDSTTADSKSKTLSKK